MDDHSAPPGLNDPRLAERVAALEWSVRALMQDLAALRTELRDRDRAAASAASTPGTGAGGPRPAPATSPRPNFPPRVGSYAPPTGGAPFTPRPDPAGAPDAPPRPASFWTGADLESLLG
ncbi:MAG TPA: hypothetical protein VGD77_09525, partial [Gemmatimonadaceae bacterium]